MRVSPAPTRSSTSSTDPARRDARSGGADALLRHGCAHWSTLVPADRAVPGRAEAFHPVPPRRPDNGRLPCVARRARRHSSGHPTRRVARSGARRQPLGRARRSLPRVAHGAAGLGSRGADARDAASAGETGEAGDVAPDLSYVYDELRRLAHRHLEREATGHTLTTTDVVHQAYVALRSTEGAVTARSADLRDGQASADLAGKEVRDLGVAGHGFHHAGGRVQPERMGASLALENAAVKSKLLQQRVALHRIACPMRRRGYRPSPSPVPRRREHRADRLPVDPRG
jgi:ECF sigma factor